MEGDGGGGVMKYDTKLGLNRMGWTVWQYDCYSREGAKYDGWWQLVGVLPKKSKEVLRNICTVP